MRVNQERLNLIGQISLGRLVVLILLSQMMPLEILGRLAPGLNETLTRLGSHRTPHHAGRLSITCLVNRR